MVAINSFTLCNVRQTGYQTLANSLLFYQSMNKIRFTTSNIQEVAAAPLTTVSLHNG